jgi:hypothetical protein
MLDWVRLVFDLFHGGRRVVGPKCPNEADHPGNPGYSERHVDRGNGPAIVVLAPVGDETRRQEDQGAGENGENIKRVTHVEPRLWIAWGAF